MNQFITLNLQISWAYLFSVSLPFSITGFQNSLSNLLGVSSLLKFLGQLAHSIYFEKSLIGRLRNMTLLVTEHNLYKGFWIKLDQRWLLCTNGHIEKYDLGLQVHRPNFDCIVSLKCSVVTSNLDHLENWRNCSQPFYPYFNIISFLSDFAFRRFQIFLTNGEK